MPKRPENAKTLTPRSIEQLHPRATEFEVADDVVAGLRVLVYPSGRKAFILRYTVKGEYRKVTISRVGEMELKDARERARAIKGEVSEGRDPRAESERGVPADDTLAARITLYRQRVILQGYGKKRSGPMAAGTADYFEAELDRLQDEFPDRVLRSIKKSEITTALDKTMKRGPSAACTTWKVWRAFFNFCVSILDDYASPMNGIAKPAAETNRERVLPDAELKAVWLAADKAGGTACALVKLLILTGCRLREILDLQRREITETAIELPAERVKNRRAHSIPITPMMRAILDTLPKSGKYVLTGRDAAPGSHSKLKAAIKTADVPHWTFHDLRRSFSTGSQELGVLPHVIDRAINHRSGEVKGSAGVYLHYKYKAEVLAAFKLWSEHVAEITKARKLAA